MQTGRGAALKRLAPAGTFTFLQGWLSMTHGRACHGGTAATQIRTLTLHCQKGYLLSLLGVTVDRFLEPESAFKWVAWRSRRVTRDPAWAHGPGHTVSRMPRPSEHGSQ